MDIVSKVNIENYERGGDISRFAFQNMSLFFNVALINRGSKQVDLEVDTRDDIAQFAFMDAVGKAYTFETFLKESSIEGLTIAHKGKLVYEFYNGLDKDQRHMCWSVTKICVSTLVALLEDRGLIDVHKNMDEYIPELKKGGYEGVKVIDVLDMTSGIDCVETSDSYTDPCSPHHKLQSSLGMLKKYDYHSKQILEDSTYEFLAGLKRKRPPGELFEYSSANTILLVWLIEKVTGKPFYDVFSKEIWSKIGAKHDAYIITNKKGICLGDCGLNCSLNDLTKFGMLFTKDYNIVSEENIVSESMLDKIVNGGRPSIYKKSVLESIFSEVGKHNTYQWDTIYYNDAFMKTGFAGQAIYINPEKDLVMAHFGVATEEDIAKTGGVTDIIDIQYKMLELDKALF